MRLYRSPVTRITYLALIAATLLTCTRVRAQDDASKAYDKAYGFILDEKWADAKTAFDDFIKNHSKSKLSDAAHYWDCFTREKLGDTKEQVFACYQDFIKRFPKSKWVTDAKTNMLSLASQLAREGKHEYEEMVRGMDKTEDEDVKLTALYALGNMGSEKAFSTIVSLYDQMPSDNLRSKIVYILGNFESAESKKKLEDIAMHDRSAKVRKDAIYAIGNIGGRQSVEALKKIIRTGVETEIRTAALYTLGNSDDESAVPFLGEVARTDADVELAKAATNAIGNTSGAVASSELRRVLKEAINIEVRKAALYSLGNSGGADATAALRDIALND